MSCNTMRDDLARNHGRRGLAPKQKSIVSATAGRD